LRAPKERFDSVHEFLGRVFGGDLHAKRILSLTNGMLGVMTGAALAVSLIGQALATARGLIAKSAFKQADRLLSNAGVFPAEHKSWPAPRQQHSGVIQGWRIERRAPFMASRQRFAQAAMTVRPVKSILQAKPTIEGAGVKLRRAFGFGETTEFDPFLLMDDFRNDRPEDYRAGFPWHPHRGIETITYVLAGSVEHRDSLGNMGSLGAGDVQWMTAGSGILHQEMPEGDAAGRMHGFQLWANLPASLKMTAPRYQDVKAAEIPEIVDDDGTRVRVICGEFWGRRGPVEGVAAEPSYLDVFVPAGLRETLPVATKRHAFAYVFEGAGAFHAASSPFGALTEKSVDGRQTLVRAGDRSLVLFDSGDEITVEAGEEGIRFLLVSGKPLNEPIAWYGPIVMNTQEQLQAAARELRDGTFIKRA
jgi:quercetin 2,3-dioxygenase